MHDATEISARTAGLQGLDLAKAYQTLATETLAGLHSRGTTDLLRVSARYRWLRSQAAASAATATRNV